MSRKFGALLFLFALLAVGMVSAQDIEILEVELDGDELDESGSNTVRAIDRDNKYEVRVKVLANADVDDAQVEVYLRGYDHDDRVEDISDVFDMKAGRTYIEKFSLAFPYKMDKDTYKLRVRVEDRNGEGVTKTYDIEIESERHDMKIKDVVFSPSNAVLSGRSLLTTVRLKNTGMVDDDEGVKVSVSIPELGISAADYIDEIEEDDAVTSEELYLRIPSCTAPGQYDVEVEVVYDDGDEVETWTGSIAILEDEACNAKDDEDDAPAQPKTIITVGPTTQEVMQGTGGVIYPLTLSNAGKDARTYVITADGYADWADIQISPANIVVLQPGEAKALYVYLSAKADAQSGEHMFSLKITSGAETLKEFAMKANVKEAAGQDAEAATNWTSIKRVLEIGLVVLVVLLVILGLIIGFSRLKGNDDVDEEEGKSETYY